jgi:hypothetical protein
MSPVSSRSDEFENIIVTTDDEDNIMLTCELAGCPADLIASGLSSPSMRSFIMRSVTHNQQYHGAEEE